jgi:acetyl-CoA C-acetyltransferase
VPDCDLALVNAIGGQLAVRHAPATLILERAA